MSITLQSRFLAVLHRSDFLTNSENFPAAKMLLSVVLDVWTSGLVVLLSDACLLKGFKMLDFQIMPTWHNGLVF